MKTVISIAIIFVSLNEISTQNTEALSINESQFAKTHKFGISSGVLINGKISSSYQLGITNEFRVNGSSIRVEAELNGEYKEHNLDLLGVGKADEVNLDFALNSKYYLSARKLFFGKIGYYINQVISQSEFIEAHGPIGTNRDFNSGFQTAFGYSWDLKDSGSLKFEALLRYNKLEEFHSGFRIGILI